MLSRVAFFSFYNCSTIVPMNKKMVDTCEKMLGLRERCGRVSFSIYSILLSVMERLDTTRNTTRVAAFGSNEVLIPRCKYWFHDHKREGVGLSVGVGVGGRRIRTRGTRKERKKDTVRHVKETDRYSKTDATGDHDYLFCGEDRTQ